MFSQNKTCFSVRDGALVGDFKDANQPMVWRMDLSRVHAAGFRVVQNGGQWDLVIESPNGAATAVAGYNSADKANRALRNLSSALSRSGGWSRFTSRVGLLALILLGVFVVYQGLPRLLSSSPRPVAASTQPQGTALPADQVLRIPSNNK